MAANPTPPKPPVQIHEAILALPKENIEAMRAEIASRQPRVEEFGPAYAKIAAASPAHAANFAVAYGRTMKTTADLGKLFGMVAVAPAADRHAIVVAHRDAGDGVTVVHAVGAQPTAMARPLMKDFLMDGGNVHAQAAGDLAEWLQMAGGMLIETGVRPPPPTALHDGFFGDLWNDIKSVGGAIVHAATTVVDAVGSAVGDFVKGIGHAIGAVVNWAAAQVKNFVHALLSAGKAIGDLISGALNAGYAGAEKDRRGRSGRGPHGRAMCCNRWPISPSKRSNRRSRR